jgi:hypothetical protein
MDKEAIKAEIAKLTEAREATDDFVERLDLHTQIHLLDMKLKGVTPTGHNPIECEGCGS